MINKQKMWFLTLFSLILVLSIYYITMPSEIVTTSKKENNKTEKVSKENKINDVDVLTVLQIEKDEERAALTAEYNEILTNDKTSTEEKNNAYEGIKKIDDYKAKEELLCKKIKDKLKLESFIEIENNNINVTIKKKDHDYSLANDVMRLIQEEYKDRVYISVRFES